MRRRAIMSLAIALTAGLEVGCTPAEFLTGLTKVMQGSQYLHSAIDVAEAGADAFFRRHPSMDREAAVAKAIRVARQATAALDAALATIEDLSDKDWKAARSKALDAWDALKSILDEFKIPQAVPPDGGAENTAAPTPEPFDLPTRDRVAAMLSTP